MSPLKKASAVDSLRKATAPAPPATAAATNGKPAAAKARPVRITLDLDPADYTALNQWLGSTAAEVGAPVSKAQALRAMIKAVSLDKSIGLVVTDLLRRERAD